MAKRRDLAELMEEFKESRVWKEIVEYLDAYVDLRGKELIGLTGNLGLDFDQKYSNHDLVRANLRFIELVMKKIPDEIIEEENRKEMMKEMEAASQIQENVDAFTEMEEAGQV